MKPRADVAKIANSLSRPGIDPRKFVDVGVVTAVDVTSEGAHVDVTTSEGLHETAQVSPPYGGPGYGLHLPIDLDDAVVLGLPDGVFDAGARVIGRTWDAGEPPPQDAIDHPEDVVLVVKPGQSVRIIVSGGGNVVIEPRDGGKVLHGGEDADDPVIRRSDLKKFIDEEYKIHAHGGVTSGSSSTLPIANIPTTPDGSSVTFTK